MKEQLSEAERGRRFANKATAADIADKIRKWIDDGKLAIDVADTPGQQQAALVFPESASGTALVRLTVFCDVEAVAVVSEVERLMLALPVRA